MISLSDYLQRELYRPSETEIIVTLQKLMSEEQKEVCVCEPKPLFELKGHPGHRFWGDLYAPKGIEGLGIDKPVMVEVKAGLLISTFQREFEKGKTYVETNEDEGKIYLVVYANTRLDIPSFYEEYDGNVKFVSYDYICSRLEEYSKKVGIKAKPDNKAQTYSFVSRSQEELIDEAACKLSKGHVTFVLGAGVSVEAGAPQWNDILQKLIDKNTGLNPLTSSHYESINSSCGWSQLITARYVIDGWEKKDLIKNMRSLIYGEGEDRKAKKEKKDLPTLSVIAEIIKNCNVDSVITFNYDEFLEEALDNEGKKCISIHEGGALGDEFPVFHVHGLISREDNKGKTNPVLSEEEYHLLYSDNFDWSNVEIMHALMRTTCFFVGLSMSDPNLRRLLDIAKKRDDRDCPHYLFLRKSPLDKNKKDQKDCDKKHHTQLERQFSKMGINVIWFEYNPNDDGDFSDLPKKLQKIYDKAKQN